MLFRIRTMLALLAASPLLAGAAKAEDVPLDVKADHWAYEAVSDLAKKGLIKGYPPDGRFLGGRTLTRYEMATIIKRVLDRMDEMVKNPKGVSVDDFNTLKASVAEIQRLTEEFKTQLAVIGTDLTGVKNDLTALKGQVNDLSARVDTFDTRINTLSTRVDATTVLADKSLAGIKELRDQLTGVNAALAKKVDVGIGRLRVSGLIQEWYGVGFGDTIGGNITATTPSGLHSNFGTTPAGRNYGFTGPGDSFRLRRGEITMSGAITPVVDFLAKFDVAKTNSNATSPANSVLQDLWVGYQLASRVHVEIGQQKTSLTEEGPRSSAQLLTVERSVMNSLPGGVGRVGDIRDTGAILRYQGRMGRIGLGIWDDNGTNQNTVDSDRFKFATASGFFTGLRYVTVGAWGGTNLGDYRPRNIRDRAGATLIIDIGRHYAEAEFGFSDDRTGSTPRTRALGGYALYAYSLSKQWQFVSRYDEWDPSIHGGVVGTSGAIITRSNHNEREYTFGVNYYIRSNNAKVQLNYIIEDPQSGGIGFWGYRRQILLSNFQTAW